MELEQQWLHQYIGEEIEKNQGEENLEKRKDEEQEIRENLVREDFEKYKKRAVERVEKEKKR